MTAITDGIGFRAGGIAGATLATADLTRARVFYLARLGFPLLREEGDAFTFRAGTSDITVRLEGEAPPGADGPGPPRRRVERIALWCVGLDDLRAVADALTTMGIEHSAPQADGVGTGCVAFRDPDDIEWEFRIR
jgi:catechol 2,3-dioxygenase-like lactoylglutathione lyase family enzyme